MSAHKSGMFAVGRPEGAMTPGDVLRYVPSRRHCREGMAVVDEHGRSWDTFWDSDRHHLTADELATAEVIGNLGDFKHLGSDACTGRRDHELEWGRYAPADRLAVTHQHRLQADYYVRRGATPDLDTQIANARSKVEEAEGNLGTAQRRLEWARRDLAKLEAQR